MNHDHSDQENPQAFWGSRYSIGLIVIGAVAGYFLLTEHRAHFFGALPFLLLLACPLMHVFMHGGHGHHHADGHDESEKKTPGQLRQGDQS
ncbi:MAG: DUF2933 domain-containing protein [Polaromonas sp.]